MTILAILTKFCLKFATLVNFAMSFFNASTKLGTFWEPRKFGLWVKMQAAIGPHRLFYKG